MARCTETAAALQLFPSVNFCSIFADDALHAKGNNMPLDPENMSDLMVELSLALRDLAHNMSNLAVALENDFLEQTSPQAEAMRASAAEIIDKARAS